MLLTISWLFERGRHLRACNRCHRMRPSCFFSAFITLSPIVLLLFVCNFNTTEPWQSFRTDEQASQSRRSPDQHSPVEQRAAEEHGPFHCREVRRGTGIGRLARPWPGTVRSVGVSSSLWCRICSRSGGQRGGWNFAVLLGWQFWNQNRNLQGWVRYICQEPCNCMWIRKRELRNVSWRQSSKER